jgi:hypothetical protein
MNIRVNKSMLELLGGDPEYFEPSSLEIPLALREKASTPLMELDGCIVPASSPNVVRLEDETGTECHWSKFHLEDFMPEEVGQQEIARIALDYVWLLRASLSAAELPGRFRLIVSIELSGLQPRSNTICTVRFHRLRPGQVWLADDLEEYKDEAIAACDFAISL